MKELSIVFVVTLIWSLIVFSYIITMEENFILMTVLLFMQLWVIFYIITKGLGIGESK